MKVSIELENNQYTVNTDFSFSAAIPLEFNAKQPNHFQADVAEKSSMTAGDFIGDTERGGSCNVSIVTLNPHCNGTHTESIAHICDSSAELSLPIGTITPPPLMPCVLVSVSPTTFCREIVGDNDDSIGGTNVGDTKFNGISDSYTPDLIEGDQIITRQQLVDMLDNFSNAQLRAVAIRTLPNKHEKQHQAYNADNQPAFFSREAILYLNERGVEHLLTDLPSIDRLHDDGLLTCHHLFWQVPEGMHQPTTNSLINKTITELAYFDDVMTDGFYFINLQLTAWINDATSSHPVFYAAEKQQ